MNIKPGPMIVKFANTFGCTVEETVEWVHKYVHGDVPEGMDIENDEKARLKSIQSYIQMRLDDSLASRIKGEMISARIESSLPKIQNECPF